MAEVLVLGAGMNGLTTAMLLAQDGHEVTVVERDPSGPAGGAHEAWDSWERRGVNQFRMAHFMVPRWATEIGAVLPAVLDELRGLGGLDLDLVGMLPEALTRGPAAGDERLRTVTGRRPVLEMALAAVADRTPGITVRRGVTVTGLRTGPSPSGRPPHVTGVLTEGGGAVPADLVIDTAGRRSTVPAWLEAVGSRRPYEEREDCGFVYYQRTFRSGDGTIPPAYAALLQHYSSLSVLTLPADNGTWAVVLVASGRDRPLRALRDVDTWTRALGRFPLAAHWGDGEALHPGVVTMASIEDRLRRYVVDGEPVVTGLVAVGDAWACTNPSLGRGTSIGLLHALALRDVLRDVGVEQPAKLVRRFDEVTGAELEPIYRATLAFDRHRLAELESDAAGQRYSPDDPTWSITKAMMAAAPSDPAVLRAFLAISALQATPEEILAVPGMYDRVVEGGADAPQYVLPGPDRAALLAAVQR
ncbi:MAG TPA: FAD-dependent oxidoreductase [Acidimicrobiales bacterium]|nr:FAD-dependent oxidoreductase [Acidimicrobiales bacterium]